MTRPIAPYRVVTLPRMRLARIDPLTVPFEFTNLPVAVGRRIRERFGPSSVQGRLARLPCFGNYEPVSPRQSDCTASAGRDSPMPSSRSRVSLSLVVSQGRQETCNAELVRGLISGEGWAIGETWHRFAPMVSMMAERCLGSRSEAEDICQEVFYRMLRRVKSLREPDRLRSYIYSFAVRVVRNALRRRKVRAWLSFDEPENLVDLTWEAPDMESRDLLRRFHRLLDRLTPRDRLVFSLRRMESMTVEEIARAMDISESTVKRSMAHATERLSTWMDDDPGFSGLVETLREVR